MSEKCNTCRTSSNQRKIVRIFNELEGIDETLHGNGRPGLLVRLVQLENRAAEHDRELGKVKMTVYGDGEDRIGLCGKVKDCVEYIKSRKVWIGYIIAMVVSACGAGGAAWAVAKLT